VLRRCAHRIRSTLRKAPDAPRHYRRTGPGSITRAGPWSSTRRAGSAGGHPRLVAPIIAGSGASPDKQGTYEKAFVSRVYNSLSRALFGIRVKDLNSVKAYRREVMEHITVRPDWHRYLIVLAAAQGFSVKEIPVPLYPRHAGKSKFGVSRIPVGVLDMLSVWFELRFAPKPLLFFGMLGAGLFVLSALTGTVLLATGQGVRSAWVAIQTGLMLGTILFVAGLLGELIAGLRAQLRELQRQVTELDHDR
jgi:hypothetical protein